MEDNGKDVYKRQVKICGTYDYDLEGKVVKEKECN